MALRDQEISYPALITRSELLRLLKAAVEVNSIKFARQAAITWMAAYPGDLDVNRMLALALDMDGKIDQARAILEKIIQVDPEDRDAYRALAELKIGTDEQQVSGWWGAVFALGGTVPGNVRLPEWSKPARESLFLLAEKKFQEAEELIHQALVVDSGLPLIDLLHLKINRVEQDWLSVRQLAELYRERWPDCLAFQYVSAEMLMESGDEAAAVMLLHECVTRDATGLVARRWMGDDHAYRPLWPEDLTMRFDLPVPAEVASRLGMNHLPVKTQTVPVAEPEIPVVVTEELQPEKVSTTPEPEVEIPSAEKVREEHDSGDLQNIRAEFEKIAKRLKKPAIGQADGRFPVYVILSSRIGLIDQYGQQSAEVLIGEMNHLADIVRRRQGWGAVAYLPDDPVFAAKYGLAALESNDPWKIKLALGDLDKALAHRGERIGAVLIIGGEQIVPFHKLPNPTEDQDSEVLSDNPYASTDGNYFVTEWLVGRLPGESGPDAGLLLQQMRQVMHFHEQRIVALKGWKRTIFFRAWQSWLNQRNRRRNNGGFGYSAAVWRRSSVAVFHPVGAANDVHVSPPEITGSINPKKVTSARINYYNLHGLSDTAEWYGQRDFSESGSGPDYPVALTAANLQRNGRAPSVVFSEACYGGYVIGKSEAESIALRFLSIGVYGMVASTCIAYGSISAPLVGADLLGQLFWKSLKEGYTAGEALMLAKINLIREMNRRQGYLDGEDQKTLLSFVLYGDPLASAELAMRQAKQALRLKVGLSIKTVSDQSLPLDTASTVKPEWVISAKKSVESYLPGLEHSSVQVCRQTPNPEPQPATMTKGRRKNVGQSDRYVVTITKTVPAARHQHTHYARVTVDEHGKVVKLAVSR
jgi:tetratricopeptide (TPR) repeat protein